MARIDSLLNIVLESKASDLHLSQGLPPMLRVHGDITTLKQAPLSESDLLTLLEEICDAPRWARYLKTGDLDFAYSLGEQARFRVNYLRSLDGYGAVLRLIPSRISSLDDLKLPPVLKRFAHLRDGLVLVTGPTGSGKSTTLAALVDYINENQARHILTIEEPIEFVHPCKKSVIIQREVGVDVHSFADALKSSVRQDLDIVLVGEMRTPEIIALALKAAEMGTLVYATLHTNSAAKTIDRIIDCFPAEQQDQIRVMLANSLKGICAQLLIKTKDGKGRRAVNEILIDAPGLGNTIREGKLSMIESIIQSGRKDGMQLMDDVLFDLQAKGLVSPLDAYMKAQNKGRFAPLVEESGHAE